MPNTNGQNNVWEFRVNGETWEVSAPTQEQAITAFQRQMANRPHPQGQSEWERGNIAPVERNSRTGQLRPAVPQIALSALDALQLPGDAMAGRVPDLDPRMGAENMSDQTFNRVQNLSGMATTITPASRFATPPMPRMMPDERAAVNRVSAALRDDQLTPQAARSQLQQLGPDAMLMDLGPNLQQRAGGLASVPGPARQNVFNAVEGRAKAAGARIQDDVQNTFGVGQSQFAMLRDIDEAQAAASRPLYDAVRPRPLNESPNIRFVTQTPMGQRAFNQARQMAANDGFDTSTLTVGLLDYAKRALDDIAGTARRTGANNEARQAADLARILTREADDQVPAYASARETYAGFAKVQDAVEYGNNIFSRRVSPDEFRARFDEMSPSEQEALIQGARTAIEEAMGNAVNDPLAVRNLLRRSFNEDKLKTLLGEQEAANLMRIVDREQTFGDTRNVVTQNSQTAARQAAQQEAAPQMGRTQRPVGMWDTVLRIFDAARDKIRGPMQQRANQAMSRMLTSNDVDPRVFNRGPTPMQRLPGSSMLNTARAAPLGMNEQYGGGGGY